MTKKMIIFDFDGTIADTLLLGIQIASSLSKDYSNKNIHEDEIEKFRGFTAQELIQYLKISKLKLPIIALRFQKLLNSRINEMKMVQGMKEVVLELHKKYILGIVTSNSKENVAHLLKSYNLEAIFEFIHCERNIFGKSQIFKKILKQFSLDSNDAIYIGDETRDIEAAKKIDMDIISVTWGFNNKEVLLRKNPGFVIDNPEQLSILIESL